MPHSWRPRLPCTPTLPSKRPAETTTAQQIVETLEGDGDTSGPWKYDDFNPKQIIDAESTTIASVFGRMSDDRIQMANARLIGAAPVMREYVRSRSETGDDAATGLLKATESQGAPA